MRVGFSIRASSWIALCCALGCEPVQVRFASGPVADPMDEIPYDPILVESEVLTSGTIPCRHPAARANLGPYELRTTKSSDPKKAYLWAGGVMAGDLDQDGALEVLAPSEPGMRIFRGGPGGRLKEWRDPLSGFQLDYGTGGTLADYDGDGDLDVLLLRWDLTNVLLRNDGGGSFTDVTLEVGLRDLAASTTSAWADVDRDGDLDLFVGSYDSLAGVGVKGGSFLYENHTTEEGTVFVDRSDSLPNELRTAYTRVAGFHDLDADGYPELYVVNDIGSVQSNVLLRNHQGRLVPDDNASGLDLAMSGGGLGVGDLNGDGVLDLLIPQWDEISLMMSEGDGRWADYAQAMGLRADPDLGQRVGWGAELADLDNDGDLDAVVSYGFLDVAHPRYSNPLKQPDALFLNQDGTFVDVAAQWGVADQGRQRGFVVVDLNNDGWLDLVKRDLAGPDPIYVSRCGTKHWLMLELFDPTSPNSLGVGARVEVVAGEQTFLRTVLAGGTGFGTGGPPQVHVGLGDIERIDHVRVYWPDGTESVVAFDLEVDQRVAIHRLQ
ncbi:MAG: CRTAC1 family protein [Myxococcales bacterium]|nr:CRTAC1 family protein [Myxococcales bacterium]